MTTDGICATLISESNRRIKMEEQEIKEVIRLHGLWLKEVAGGVRANLHGADLNGADLRGADLRLADLNGANLSGADLLAIGNMRELRTLHIDTWRIGYTHDTLQIGCQTHEIEKWRKWNTPAGRKWVSWMDVKALKWADRNLALVLAIIDANPATPPH